MAVAAWVATMTRGHGAGHAAGKQMMSTDETHPPPRLAVAADAGITAYMDELTED